MIDRYAEWRKINFSDITDFDPENFIFLTHSLPNEDSRDFFKTQISNTKLFSDNQNFDLSKFPFAIKNKKRISCALTSSKNCYTYGRIGYIVSSPIENILYIGQASFNETNDELRNKDLLSPEDVFDGKVLFNEVVLEGSTMYGVVKPLAIFINLTDASVLEQYMVMQKLNEIEESTFGMYPVLDLTNNKLELKKSGKSK